MLNLACNTKPKARFTNHPFGSVLQGRSWTEPSLTAAYRFGFNGKDKVDEIEGDGNAIDFGARVYDSRLGRWMSVDPLESAYPRFSPYSYVANMPLVAIDPNGKEIIIPTTKKSYTGSQNPTTMDEVAITWGDKYFQKNGKGEWDLILQNEVVFSSAFKTPGENGQTLEEENPGLTKSTETHEDIHVSRNIEAAHIPISFTTDILGGSKNFTGTADKVMTDIYNLYINQRGKEKDVAVIKKQSELATKYDPLIESAKGDETKIEVLKKQQATELDQFKGEFDKETDNKVASLAKGVLDIVSMNSRTLNRHNGSSGVINASLDKMKYGTSEYKIQYGTTPVKWQGVEIKPSEIE